MSADPSPLISVIVVSWNTRELLQRCLQSIRETIPPLSYEVIVVDNDSSDGSADMVAEQFPEAILIRSDCNLGFSAGNNLGLSRASGRYVLLLNPDAELFSDSVASLIRFAESHPRAGVVGPSIVNPDGSVQKNGRRFPFFMREVLGITRAYKLVWPWFDRRWEYGRDDFSQSCQVDEVCGACMLIRRSAFNEVGLMDERFFMYYEEVDLCRRMRDRGWEVWYCAEAQIKHHWAQGAQQVGLKGSRIFYRSQFLYFLKHHGVLQAYVLRLLSATLLALLYVKKALFRPHTLEQEVTA